MKTSAHTAPEGLAEQRRREILEAAEKLLATYGYDALRLRQVSQAANVSIGLIQHYFGTRDDLLRETMHVAGERRAQQWKKLGENKLSPADRLMALIEGAIGDHHRCVMWIETCAAATRHPELRPGVRATQNAWRDIILDAVSAGMRDGTLNPVLPSDQTAELLIRLIDGFMLDDAAGVSSKAARKRRGDALVIGAQRLIGI
ncbi:TetR/AcrR family transcriptional regulator [Kribbella speibonae]|uniref:TetR/AcrR family transcriptional regulator n=1 Tax=Kribbella speibonae TaxID=1572660 RepID=UPI0013F3D98A|nr:TetR/AcrR family transcriptional regulator [Kribbella speibonae]